jgi:hypothetical protein
MVLPRQRCRIQKGREEMLTQLMCGSNLEGNQLGSRAQRWENIIKTSVRRIRLFYNPTVSKVF